MKSGSVHDVRLVYDEMEGKFNYTRQGNMKNYSHLADCKEENQALKEYMNTSGSTSRLQRFNSMDSYLSAFSDESIYSEISVPNPSVLGRNQSETKESMYSPSILGSPSALIDMEKLQRFLPRNIALSDSCLTDYEWSHDIDSGDNFRMFEFKIRPCMRDRSHDWTDCPFAHPGEKARRRDPRVYHYSGMACPEFRKGNCRKGDSCEFAHGVFECWLHPARYRTQLCKDGRACRRRVCFFAHTNHQIRHPTCVPGTNKSCLCFSSPNHFGSPNSPLLGQRIPPFLRKHTLERVSSLPSKSSLSVETNDRDVLNSPFSEEFSSREKFSNSTDPYSPASMEFVNSGSPPLGSFSDPESEMMSSLKALDLETSLDWRSAKPYTDLFIQKIQENPSSNILEKDSKLSLNVFQDSNLMQRQVSNQNHGTKAPIWNAPQDSEWQNLQDTNVHVENLLRHKNLEKAMQSQPYDNYLNYQPPSKLPASARLQSWKSMPANAFSEWEAEADAEENAIAGVERVESGRSLRASIYGLQSMNMAEHIDALEFAWINDLENNNFASDFDDNKQQQQSDKNLAGPSEVASGIEEKERAVQHPFQSQSRNKSPAT